MKTLFATLWMCCCCGAATQFRERVVATGLTGGYQVVVADVNHDGKPDLIALASGMSELVWFENPGWERHVIAGGLTGMINLAAWDADGDGIPLIVLAHGFSMDAKKSAGIVSVLRHQGDPRGPWSIREIDRLTTSHRLRWADIHGNGKKVLMNAPLTGALAEAPDYRGHVPLVYYDPADWKRHLIDDRNEGILHGLTIVDWLHTGADAILTAGFSGIHIRSLSKSGEWTREELSKSGASDVAVGQVDGERFLAAIEPWHGNQVVVYRKDGGRTWERRVIDDTLLDAHTILTADFEGHGRDAIVAGFRGQPHRVYLYTWDGKSWTRSTIDDGGISAAACAIADLNGDGRPDVACIGSATANLKWYENVSGEVK